MRILIMLEPNETILITLEPNETILRQSSKMLASNWHPKQETVTFMFSTSPVTLKVGHGH